MSSRAEALYNSLWGGKVVELSSEGEGIKTKDPWCPCGVSSGDPILHLLYKCPACADAREGLRRAVDAETLVRNRERSERGLDELPVPWGKKIVMSLFPRPVMEFLIALDFLSTGHSRSTENSAAPPEACC